MAPWVQAGGISVNVGVSSIDHAMTGLGFATVGSGSWSDGTYRSTDYGQNWQVVDWWIYASIVAMNPLWQSYPNDTCGIFAGDSGLGVKYSSDCGNTWQEVNSGLGNWYVNMLSFHPQDSMRLYAATQGGLYRYYYGPGISEIGVDQLRDEVSIVRNILRASEPIHIRRKARKVYIVRIFDSLGRLVHIAELNAESVGIQPLGRTGVFHVFLTTGSKSYQYKIIVIE